MGEDRSELPLEMPAVQPVSRVVRRKQVEFNRNINRS